jgi:transcriptional regulator GlxA family with amidase domain
MRLDARNFRHARYAIKNSRKLLGHLQAAIALISTSVPSSASRAFTRRPEGSPSNYRKLLSSM